MGEAGKGGSVFDNKAENTPTHYATVFMSKPDGVLLQAAPEGAAGTGEVGGLPSKQWLTSKGSSSKTGALRA